MRLLEHDGIPGGVTEDEVIDMNRRLSGGDASLNATVGSDGDCVTQWQDWLEDEDWLRSEATGGTGPGSGRRTLRYRIHPAIKGKRKGGEA